MADNARDQLGVELPDPKPPEAVVPPAPGTDRPEWLPEKFESPEAYVQSYSDLERELKQRAEDQKALESRVEELTNAISSWQPDPQQQQYQPEPSNSIDQTREQLTAMYETDPIGTMALLASQFADQRVNQAMQQAQQQQAPYQAQQQQNQNQMLAITVDRAMADRHDDWETLKPMVAEAVQKDPWLLPEQVLAQGPEAATSALERVYTMAKAQTTLQQIESGTYDQNRSKQMAQTMSGNGARGGEVDPVDEKMARLQAATKGMSYSALRGSA